MHEPHCNDPIWNDVLVDLYKKHHKASRLSFPEERQRVLQALEDDTYEFKPPRLVKIPKGNGKLRNILVMELEDNIIMNYLYRCYRDNVTVHPAAVAYQPGKSVASIVHNISTKHLTKYDIHAYFDSVPIELIDKALDELNIYPAVKRFFHDNRVYINGELTPYYKGICQGCPLSALLANMCLYTVDDELYKNSTTYIRYSDDIITDAPENLVRDSIQRLGLELSEQKVKAVYNDYDFLGAHIYDGKCGIGSKGKHNLKKAVKDTVKCLKTDTRPQIYLNKAVRRVFKTLAYGQFSSLAYWRQICTTPDDFIWLDKVIRNAIAQHYTDKANVTHNQNVFTPSMWEKAWMPDFEWLYHLGTYPMLAYAYYLVKHSQKLMSYNPMFELNEVVVEALWENASVLAKPYFLSFYEQTDNTYDDITAYEDQTRLLEILHTCVIDFENKPYKQIDSLILFEKWFDCELF